jgi:hypothetical protein
MRLANLIAGAAVLGMSLLIGVQHSNADHSPGQARHATSPATGEKIYNGVYEEQKDPTVNNKLLPGTQTYCCGNQRDASRLCINCDTDDLACSDGPLIEPK